MCCGKIRVWLWQPAFLPAAAFFIDTREKLEVLANQNTFWYLLQELKKRLVFQRM